ncbi:amino acid ABC transporter permease [Rhodovulum sp. FJ3]|uniref:amino acid ABC transporter permease n=1 Tax=Rhodovulum sp. FJ3 TaxID=3079053 RepID=UPI00293DFE1E|nr:amino acid ABC transporter permease [Rhodovulum sp. FJ3]MDV4167371.1 amino acid ABC transporter permease [Rhodovulum sp. FJ3]
MSDTHAQTVAYVRETMLEQKEPPITETGAIKWLRENLFSGATNIILTVVSIFVIVWGLGHILPWFLNSIWDAGSLTECREIRNELYGSDASSACFAVISARWHQLLFGFYPQELYWRPVLAFVLLLSALAPVLFNNLPRKLLTWSMLAPFVLYFLLWGGTIWGPLMVLAGFVLGSVAFRFGEQVNAIIAVLAAILVPVLFWLFLAGPIAGALSELLPIGITKVESKDMGGFMLATIIGVSGITLSLPLGIVLALGRQSDMFLINKMSVAFIETIRGVPLIVWLFTASLLLNYFLPRGTNFDLMLRVIIMVTLFASAYIAEVVRGGLAALPKGQYEAADALGLDYWKSMRLIVLPQALKISIPGIVNTFIGLFKDTTLVVFIGLLDPIGLSNTIRATTEWNGIYWELFVFIGLMFFIFCFSMGRYSLFLEKKLQRGHR